MPGGVTTEVRTYQMYINGEWVASKSAKTFPVYDPSTEEVIAQVPDAGPDDVNHAVAAAKVAFEDGPWSTSTAQERGRVLFRLSEKIRANLRQLVRRRQHQLAHSLPVVAIDALHVLAQRVRMHRHFRMTVRAHQLRAFDTDRAIAERSAFGGAGDDADVVGYGV